jgi:hypothetical protein
MDYISQRPLWSGGLQGLAVVCYPACIVPLSLPSCDCVHGLSARWHPVGFGQCGALAGHWEEAMRLEYLSCLVSLHPASFPPSLSVLDAFVNYPNSVSQG